MREVKQKNNYLEMQSIVKRYATNTVVDHVDFFVNKGEIHCLVGENGAGKTTLIKILCGIIQADEVKIFMEGVRVKIDHPNTAHRMGISVIPQELNLLNELTVGENVFLGVEPKNSLGLINWEELHRKTEKQIYQEFGIKLDSRELIKNLSVANKQLVMIAGALRWGSKVLILDEPTARLSKEEIKRLFEIIRNFREEGNTIIYISHHLEEIREIGDIVTVLRDGKRVITEKLQNLNLDKIIEYMTGKKKGTRVSLAKTVIEDETRKKKLLEVRGMLNEKVKNIDLDVYEGEILAIAGVTGSGRSEIARAICGIDHREKGEIKLMGKKVKITNPVDAIRIGIIYVPEDRKSQGLFQKMPVFENILLNEKILENLSTLSFYLMHVFKTTAQKFIELLNIIVPSLETPCFSLSGGNQQKVLLGKWLTVEPTVIILDEPTRGIDVGVKFEFYEIINKLAKKQNKGIILISSELPEIMELADRILILKHGEIVKTYFKKNINEAELLQVITTVEEENETKC
jgi:ABC-type sugar transport system ATPase subunit